MRVEELSDKLLKIEEELKKHNMHILSDYQIKIRQHKELCEIVSFQITIDIKPNA